MNNVANAVPEFPLEIFPPITGIYNSLVKNSKITSWQCPKYDFYPIPIILTLISLGILLIFIFKENLQKILLDFSMDPNDYFNNHYLKNLGKEWISTDGLSKIIVGFVIAILLRFFKDFSSNVLFSSSLH